MKILNQYLKNPVFWFLLILLAVSCFYKNVYENNMLNVISSDGRGYYAYLPAIFIYGDNSFEKVVSLEEEVYNAQNQCYLYHDNNGKTYNKFYPGIAVLQLPFFALACCLSWLFNQPVDGYSDLFHYLFLLGSYVYFSLGIVFFVKALKILFPSNKRDVPWVIFILTFASPLFFYMLQCPSFTHLYSFSLFGMFSYLFLQLIKKKRIAQYFLLGILLGLIFLLRPTNLLILLVIPMFFDSWNSFISLLHISFANRAKLFLTSLLGFFIPVFILLLSWKWQSGSWIIWSYTGEGFNFLHPKFFETLFSYRIGLFVHTPILLLSIVGVVFLYRKQKYRTISYLIYFLLTVFVTSSWWCWDYESSFGNRPFTEHMVFLMIPVFAMLKTYKRIIYPVIIFFAIIGMVRTYQSLSGVCSIARYNSNSYWNSLISFGEYQKGRWEYTKSCVPYGSIVSNNELLSQSQKFTFSSEMEYGLNGTLVMPKPRTNERYYFSVQLEKKHDLDRFEDVYLVIDATSNDSQKRYYRAINLYNDREEGKGEWSEVLMFEGTIHDNFQEFDKVSVYIWNKNRVNFDVRNVKYTVSVYKSKP